ncbi:MAG: enoyl-CoA hydratase/isomerase family protein [Myxococcales bacterium]|jgi:enoyl-CoA hydratase/carnithine racemase
MSDLNLTVTDGAARLVLDRAESLNAISPDALTDLIDACAALSSNDEVRVVVLEGAGGCFSAGADLPAFMAAFAGPDAHSLADLGRRATNAVAEIPQITIAGIRGHCVGGGLVLAGACDLRIASQNARFLIPELDAGIPLGWGGLDHLVRLVGETVAADWVLSCRSFTPEEALRAGLVSRVVPTAELERELGALAAAVARKPASVLRTTKQQLSAIRSGTFDATADANALLSALRDPEAMQAGRDYLTKRFGKKAGPAR